ncbi:hypothetical protein [Hymenobacter actinosclerus]|uniref:Uncharacterized protein n=1 Tax=Hymenobacter actinosclerus TaxID=82805 RepID=A0A1H9ZFR8_9BACT|nr:hypothetical protein [Hymenobacter actinosclerus]SES80156.1 hypothetical protein SAMN04487998_0302 [Hymenobacter actinosclerus]
MTVTTALAEQMVAVAPAATPNVNPNTDPKRMAVVNVGSVSFRGACKSLKIRGLTNGRHTPRITGVTGAGMARVAQCILSQTNIRYSAPFLINRENVI